jgi:hypothetical protein
MHYRLKIQRDEDPTNYRKEGEPLTRMVCWRHRYNLGDEQPMCEPEEWKTDFDTDHPDAYMMPLYLYDHGGITISTGAFSCPWDSGQVGWIYILRETIRQNWPTLTEHESERAMLDKAEEVMRHEVKEYDDYLTGNVWGFELVKVVVCDHGDEHEEHEESCWGFYGDDAKDAMRDHLSEEHRPLLDAAWGARQ